MAPEGYEGEGDEPDDHISNEDDQNADNEARSSRNELIFIAGRIFREE